MYKLELSYNAMFDSPIKNYTYTVPFSSASAVLQRYIFQSRYYYYYSQEKHKKLIHKHIDI